MSFNTAAEIYRSNPEVARQADEQWQQLLSRSATDAEFRQQLLTDPRAAVEKVTGRPAPESFNVKFIENKADATIVLPDFVDASAELSEGELEAVAGGSDPVTTTVITVLVLIDTALITMAILDSHAKAN